MSCLSFDYKSDVVNWLRVHGIYNYFILDSAKAIVKFLNDNQIKFTICIDDMVHITTGLPSAAIFDICSSKVTYRALGELQAGVAAWDYYTNNQTLIDFIQQTDCNL